MLPLAIRDFLPLIDSDFVYATWIKSYRNSAASRPIISTLYEKGQRYRIDKLLGLHSTWVRVATNPEEERVIYGWAVGTGENLLHYVYVKGDFRGLGIGSLLLQPLMDREVLFTHKGGEVWLENKLRTDPTFNQFVYDPYWLEAL